MGAGWLPEMGGHDDDAGEAGGPRDEEEEPLDGGWTTWLASSLDDLRVRKLLRVQRPTIALKSSTRVRGTPHARMAPMRMPVLVRAC
jgi:hypothetical protein